MDFPELIRNVALVGNIHSGKTSFVDCLISQTRPDLADIYDKEIKYTDSLFTEKERGIGIKCAAVSLVLADIKEKSYLLNIIDTPGHINFTDEVTAAFRLVDGVMLVVDSIEGVNMNVQRLVKHAIQEKLSITLCINKIDRLILELKLPPLDAYIKIKQIIDEINILITTYSTDNPVLLSPPTGNVLFASSRYRFCFTLKSMAVLYQNFYERSIDVNIFASKLWGDFYFDQETRKFIAELPKGTHLHRSFIQFVLEPIYKIFSQTVGDVDGSFKLLCRDLRVNMNKSEMRMNVNPLLTLFCKRFFGPFNAFVDVVSNYIPSPLENAPNKIFHLYTGDLNTTAAQSLVNCDPNGPLVMHVSKVFSSQDGLSFYALARVFSGCVKINQSIRVLGENYTLDDDEDSKISRVGRVLIPETRYNIPVSFVPAGNLILLEGVDETIVKTATIVEADNDHEVLSL